MLFTVGLFVTYKTVPPCVHDIHFNPVGAFHKMPDISQVLSRQLTGALTSASDRIQDRWVLLWASLLIKQGTM